VRGWWERDAWLAEGCAVDGRCCVLGAAGLSRSRWSHGRGAVGFKAVRLVAAARGCSGCGVREWVMCVGGTR